jgi:transposase InsO family protein
VLNFGNRIGNLLIKKIRRNYKKPIVDWGESKKLKNQLLAEGKTLYEEWFEVDGVRVDEQTEGAKLVHNGGEKWLIYFSDPFYLRWAWVKKDICRVKNSSVYKFSPTSDRSKKAGNADLTRLGNKGKLTLYVKNNPSATILYSDWVTPKEY